MFHIYYFLQPLDIDIFFSVIDAVHYQCNPRIQAFFFRDGGMSCYCYCVTWIYLTCIYDIISNLQFPDELVVRVRA